MTNTFKPHLDQQKREVGTNRPGQRGGNLDRRIQENQEMDKQQQPNEDRERHKQQAQQDNLKVSHGHNPQFRAYENRLGNEPEGAKQPNEAD